MASLLEPLAGLVDTSLVGQIDTKWLASLAVGTTILNAFTWMFNFLVHASTQAVSKAAGQKDYSLLGEKMKISLFLAFTIGFLSASFIFLVRKPLYAMAGGRPEIEAFIEAYFLIRLIGHPFTLVYLTLISILRGLGRVQLGFGLMTLTTFSNIGISWYLLFVQKTGLEGAAYGTVAANVIGVVLAFGFLMQRAQIREHFFGSQFSKEGWFTFGKNSIHLFGRSFFLTACFFIATRFAGSLGVIELAAHQVLLQVWLLASFFTDGVAISGNILGARFVSQGNIEKTKEIFERLLKMGGLIGIIFSVAYFFFDDFIIGIFTKDPKVILVLGGLWPLIWLSQLPNAIAFVYDGLLFGLESFGYLQKMMMIGVAAVFLPIALLSMVYNSLYPLWIALICLNLFRLVTGFNGTKKKLEVMSAA
ncbi:MAG: MATE family efflux transporter [Deltaproteobacteria bacterium]|nr:MAG: MATE family efflux transporter [Deltaproteobacteria bacterium]